MAYQVGVEGRGRVVGSGCKGVVPSDLANSSYNLILLLLLFCNRPTFCNCTICNEVHIEEKVAGSQLQYMLKLQDGCITSNAFNKGVYIAFNKGVCL